jgi:hypothetical protein
LATVLNAPEPGRSVTRTTNGPVRPPAKQVGLAASGFGCLPAQLRVTVLGPRFGIEIAPKADPLSRTRVEARRPLAESGASAVGSLPVPGSSELAEPTSPVVLAVRPRRLLARCARSFLAVPRSWAAPRPPFVRIAYGVAILAATQNQHPADHDHQQDREIPESIHDEGACGTRSMVLAF